MQNNDRARYAPSISTAYLDAIADPPEKYRGGEWPSGLTPADLNFLGPDNALFHHDTILLSPGQYEGREELLATFNLKGQTALTTIFDSLGYQFIDNPDRWQGEATLDMVLELQEAFSDWATIVDIPSRITNKGYAQFSDVATCRSITIENIRYFLKRRDPTRVRHLNVIQGQHPDQAMAWFDAVKAFPLEGWAFGGACRIDFHFLLKLVLKMRDEQLLEKAGHLHFLGTGTLSSALALTILKRGIDAILPRPVGVTYDTSTPFRQALTNFQLVGHPKLNPASFTMPMYRAPRGREYHTCDRRLPYQTSAIARRLTASDLCAKNENIQSHAWDNLSGVLVANHNLDTMLRSIDAAHDCFALEPEDSAQHIPEWLLTLSRIVPEILKSEKPGALLARHKATLQALTTSDEEDEQDYW